MNDTNIGAIGGAGEYRVILVKGDEIKTLAGFVNKPDAEKFAKEKGIGYPRSEGLVCLVWQGKDENKKRFYDIYN